MKATNLDTKEATNKRHAYCDARMRNAVNSTLYSQRQRATAEGIKYALEDVYWSKNIHINYRKKFIAIKVDGAQVKNPRQLSQLEESFVQRNITKATSAQGVIYRITH